MLPPMQARYVILCNQHGGVINDPVLLRVADDEFWFSISDSDVAPLGAGGQRQRRIQRRHQRDRRGPGPDSGAQVGPAAGEDVRLARERHSRTTDMIHETLNGHAVTISRTGFSAEVGFEIYLHDAMLHADDVWPYILEQGAEFNLRVIAPSHIRRLEAGILSYGQDLGHREQSL